MRLNIDHMSQTVQRRLACFHCHRGILHNPILDIIKRHSSLHSITLNVPSALEIMTTHFINWQYVLAYLNTAL